MKRGRDHNISPSLIIKITKSNEKLLISNRRSHESSLFDMASTKRMKSLNLHPHLELNKIITHCVLQKYYNHNE